MKLNPYLILPGTTRAAMELYQSILGGTLEVMTFGDMGMEGEFADKVMHASLLTEHGFTLYASDGPPGADVAPISSMSISISGQDQAAIRGWFEALAADGTVTVPFEKQMWGDVFGEVTDTYGVPWMFNAADD